MTPLVIRNPLHEGAADFLFMGPTAVLRVEDGGAEGGEDVPYGDALATSVGPGAKVVFPEHFRFPHHVLVDDVGDAVRDEPVVAVIEERKAESNLDFGTEYFGLLVGACGDEGFFTGLEVFKFNFVNHNHYICFLRVNHSKFYFTSETEVHNRKSEGDVTVCQRTHRRLPALHRGGAAGCEPNIQGYSETGSMPALDKDSRRSPLWLNVERCAHDVMVMIVMVLGSVLPND